MFVNRNSEGLITGVYSSKQDGYAEEFLDENAQEIHEFYERLSNVD